MKIKFTIYIFLSLLMFKFLPLNSMDFKNLKQDKDYIVIENNTNIVLNIEYRYSVYKIINEKKYNEYNKYNIKLNPKNIAEIPKKIIAYTLYDISISGENSSELVFNQSKINELINKNLKIIIIPKSKMSIIELAVSLIWHKTLEYQEQENKKIIDLLNKINIKNKTGFKLSIDKIIAKEKKEESNSIKITSFKEVKERVTLEADQSIDIILQKNENGLSAVVVGIEIQEINPINENFNSIYLNIIDDIKKFEGSRYISEIDLIIYNKIHGKIPAELAELKSSENIDIFYDKNKLHNNISNNLRNKTERNF